MLKEGLAFKMRWNLLDVMGLVCICTGCAGYLLGIGDWGWFIVGGVALWFLEIWTYSKP